MAETLSQIPTNADPERLRRLLALSGDAPNTGGAPRLSPIAPTQPLGADAGEKISQGASPSSFGLHRVDGGGFKSAAPDVPRLNRIGEDSLPASDATQLQAIGSGSRFAAIDDQTRAAVQQRNGIPTSASTDIPNVLTPPNLQPSERPALLDAPRRSLEGFKSRMAEPVNESLRTTAGGPIRLDDPTSSAFATDRLARIEDEKAHPWGSAENHPGFAGKLAHIGAKIGNIAGDIVAPGPMSLIPGTQLYREDEEHGLRRNFDTAQKGETEAASERTREKHEENIEGANENKDSAALAKQGLTRDKDGNIVADEQSPIYQQNQAKAKQAEETHANLLAYRQAQTDLANARAEVERNKDNPNSPAYKLAQQRVLQAEENQRNTAKKLQIEQDRYNADYLGRGPHGEALPGTQQTPEGQPIGPRIANAGKGALSSLNKDYVKPANDVEKSYQMMNNAYNDYKAAAAKGQELPTGAESMLALSTHLSTTFGNVKGSRVTKDMIEHHLGARSVPDSAVVAVQRLTNGDVLSPDQWDAFHKLIGESRKLSWGTAVKEAKRANLPVDFLPPDLQGEGAGNRSHGPTAPPGGGVPSFKDWKSGQTQ
jgi:hypothetical protein